MKPAPLFKTVYRDLLGFAALLALGFWLIGRGGANISYRWHWQQVPQYLYSLEDGRFIAGPLLQGLMVTLEITAVSLILAGCIGLATALLRMSSSPVGRILAWGYLETIRNTPLLVQIFFLYFVMAPILDIGRFATAVVALSMFEGAYASEIFRAGITSLAKGQWEAAFSLGLTRFDTYRKVILPQAIRRILPPLTSQAISLVKDSALVSTIAVYDLTMEGRAIIAETFMTFEIWFTVAAIYLSVTLLLSGLVALVERYYPQRS
ncbi:amino acid ABC transporter permease [Desulfogranum mediterraneum]|uniref:amino acid ABC transporter permease n=1 Tax=Desulfogranum mediterraneum TaxID=160661 RepID=UPI000415D8EA|nr:amino acid ABC transporter permease [Desulfogranum mediterraneum]